MDESPPIPPARGLEEPGVLDAMVWDDREQRLLLILLERRPWTGGDKQLWQLQEKLNAYVSFLLDGELQEAHPEFIGKPVCLQLRTVHPPSEAALGLIEQVQRQLSLMEIGLEVWHIGEESDAAD
jgi:hypothetical protein